MNYLSAYKEDAMRSLKQIPSICMIAALLLITPVFYSCDTIDKAVDKITDAIDNAVAELNQNSAEWQTIMNDLIQELAVIDDELASLINNDVQNLLDRGVAVIGAEFRCNVDFIGNRMRDALLRLKKEYLNSSTVVSTLQPYICEVVPSSVDRILIPDTVDELEFFGYDFDLEGVKLYVEQSNGTRVDITEHLVKTTHYHMSIILGDDGVDLSIQDDKFVLTYEFTELSLVKIIQGSTEMDYATPGRRTYIPPKTNGDNFFSSYPEVSCRVDLSIINYNTQIQSSLYMKAAETKNDLSTAEGTDTHIIYTAPSGKEIKEISCLNYDQLPLYIDTDTGTDYFERGSGGPVLRYEITGHADGADPGVNTQVIVEYNTIPIEMKAAD